MYALAERHILHKFNYGASFFVYFRFSQQRFYRKNVDFSRIRTRMVRVEVQVTTTAVLSTTKVKNKVDTKARSYEEINLSKDLGWFILFF